MHLIYWLVWKPPGWWVSLVFGNCICICVRRFATVLFYQPVLLISRVSTERKSVYISESLKWTNRNVFVTHLPVISGFVSPALQLVQNELSDRLLCVCVCMSVATLHIWSKLNCQRCTCLRRAYFWLISSCGGSVRACARVHVCSIRRCHFFCRRFLTLLSLCRISIYVFGFIFHSFTREHKRIGAPATHAHRRTKCFIYLGVFKLISLSPG